MNIFLLDYDTDLNVKYHCDKHVVKMCLEYAQLLSTTVRLNGIDAGYKATHVNHPCAKWVRESQSNFNFLKELALALGEEYKYRYDKKEDHKSISVVKSLPTPKLPNIGLTDFVKAIPDPSIKIIEDPIQAYREYYKVHKKHFATWKKRQIPEFMRV